MKRVTFTWIAAALALSSAAHAQAPEPAPVQAPPVALAPADSDWHARYEAARAALVEERSADAQADFEALAATAPSDADRKLALELAAVARAQLARRASEAREVQPELRTPDELAILYTTAVFYGLGTSGWLALQLQPKTFGGALLPFAIATPAAIGAVALADSYRPLRHGIPHAIAAGLYLGFGEGLWVSGYQHAYAAHHADTVRWGAERVSTSLWIGSTVGAAVGGLVGALRRPTPGRVSFTASAGIWGGTLTAFALSAIESNPDLRAQASYLAGGIGYNAGLLGGLVFGPEVAPSVARVRFLDLGGLGGALLGAGGYALFSNELGSRGNYAVVAIGGAFGLGAAWWATSGMPPDRSHDSLKPAIGARAGSFASWRPSIVPTRGGFAASVTGSL